MSCEDRNGLGSNPGRLRLSQTLYQLNYYGRQLKVIIYAKILYSINCTVYVNQVKDLPHVIYDRKRKDNKFAEFKNKRDVMSITKQAYNHSNAIVLIPKLLSFISMT